MPLSPRVHAQLKRYVNERLKAINHSRTNDKGIALPKSIIPELHVAERRYTYQRRHFDYDHSLVEGGLPRITELIVKQKKLGRKKIRILDVCAGKGLMNEFIEKLNREGENLVYTGIDVNPNERNRVRKQNPVIEKLPRNSFDLIFSIYGLIYMPDVLKALENISNALSVNGEFVCVGVPSIYLDKGYLVGSVLRDELQRLNPHLEITSTNYDSLSLVKKVDRPFNNPFKFVYAKLSGADGFNDDFLQGRISVNSSCKNYYVSDFTKKSKW